MHDIVFPKNNEKDFIEMAKQLGYDELYFCYSYPQKMPSIKSDLKLHQAYILDKKSLTKAKPFSLIRNPDDIRYVVEKSRVNLVYDMELSSRSDFMHHRNSGMNHVVAKIAADKGKTAGFSFSTILNSKNPELLGRIRQNIVLCRKYSVKTFIGSFASSPYDMRSPHDLKAFFTGLGMSSSQLRDSFTLKD